jgi:hypothetical protein
LALVSVETLPDLCDLKLSFLGFLIGQGQELKHFGNWDASGITVHINEVEHFNDI